MSIVYFANPTRGAADAMAAGQLGYIDTPAPAHHATLHRLVNAAILANTAAWVLGFIAWPEVCEWIDTTIIFAVFAPEIAWRWYQAGPDGYRNPALLFDTATVALALAPLGANTAALRVLRLARLAHTGRNVAHLGHNATVIRIVELVAGRLRRAVAT